MCQTISFGEALGKVLRSRFVWGFLRSALPSRFSFVDFLAMDGGDPVQILFGDFFALGHVLVFRGSPIACPSTYRRSP